MPDLFPSGDDPRQNFDNLKRFLSDLFGGKFPRIRWGSGTCTYTASTTTANVTVNHGLGRAPVGLAAIATATTGNTVMYLIGAPTTTQFTTRGHDVTNVARTGNETYFWIAIG